MCGFTGFWDFQARYSQEVATELACSMIEQLKTRGPDGQGIWVDPKLGLAMAHRRLAIIDLSDAGKQPMLSPSGRFRIVYNGEVYNAPQLKIALLKLNYQFVGHSDTEVMLAAFDAWGIIPAVKKFIGMFAFAVWDQKLQELWLIRDRLGVKPVYYGLLNDLFYFGSQLKSFFPHPLWQGEIDREALRQYVALNYVPTPYSIFKNFYKLEPGNGLIIDRTKNLKQVKYWDLATEIFPRKYFSTERAALTTVHELLQDSVQLRMTADVPLGAFLSGGVDSSLVVALMQANSSAKIQTFTIGFKEQSYDEAKYALQVAQHLGTAHEQLILEAKQGLALIDELPSFYDEPFADSSQLPTLLVAKLASSKVKVALSGDGGDELFAGYNRYYLQAKLISMLQWIPYKVQVWVNKMLQMLSTADLRWLQNRVLNNSKFLDRLYKLGDLLPLVNDQQLYLKLISFWGKQNPVLPKFSVDPGGSSQMLKLREQEFSAKLSDPVERMQFLDLHNYLPDDILTKVDRASMAYGLEAREPLLDHRLVELAWQLPQQFKIQGTTTKWLLKKILAQYLPQNLIERPKMGFGIPLGAWLKADLKAWASNLLDPKKLAAQGYFEPKIVTEKFKQHLSGSKNYAYELWGILMFQAWIEKHKF